LGIVDAIDVLSSERAHGVQLALLPDCLKVLFSALGEIDLPTPSYLGIEPNITHNMM
jgi:hypothetical protein